MKRLYVLPLLIASTIAWHSSVRAQDIENPQIEKAKQFFQVICTKYKNFDPSLADLYSGNAISRMIRLYPKGETKELTMEGIKIKEAVRQSMVRARSINERISFTDTHFVEEGGMVRITSRLHNELKNYSTPYEILVGKNGDGAWLIFTETIQSHP
jgi:hypothetical protein